MTSSRSTAVQIAGDEWKIGPWRGTFTPRPEVREIKPFRHAGPDEGRAGGQASSQEAPVTESELGVMTEPLN